MVSHRKVTFWKETVIGSIKHGLCVDIDKRMQWSFTSRSETKDAIGSMLQDYFKQQSLKWA